jgi:hypothetical protein
MQTGGMRRKRNKSERMYPKRKQKHTNVYSGDEKENKTKVKNASRKETKTYRHIQWDEKENKTKVKSVRV